MIRTTSTSTEQALRQRGAPYEYWFLKLNAPDLAFLVDFIVRRKLGTAEIRLSRWVRGLAALTHDVRDRWEIAGTTVRVGDGELADGRTRGVSCGATWDIRFTTGPRWLLPGRLGGALRAFDSQIVVCPGTRASGEVEVGGERFEFVDVPAVLTHYWSIRLPERWVWLSGSADGLEVEALFASQRLWRLPWPRLRVGYAYVARGDRVRYVISPLTGFGRATGTAADVRVRAWGPLAGSIEIEASLGAAATNDVGEGIRQTLLADGRVGDVEIHRAMGLETRGWR